MGQVALVTWAGGGNLPPMLELGRRLVSRGQNVSVWGPEILRDSVEEIGAQLVVPEHVVYPDLKAAQQGPEQSVLEEMMFGLQSARSIAVTIDKSPADVMVVDCMQFGALIATAAAGVRAIPFLHTRYGFFTEPPLVSFIDEWIGPPLTKVRGAFGLSGFDDRRSIARQVWEAAPAAISMLSPALESELSKPVANLVHAGPLFPRAPETSRRSVNRPKILVSFSTTMMNQSEVMGRVVTALGSLDVDGLVTLGDVSVEPPIPPENVEVVAWIDPFDELPTASLVVTHGGMGTILATLAHGVPLLTLPMGRDQDGNAARVEEIGAGLALSLEASADRIAEQISALLREREFVRAAQRVAAEIEGLDGGSAATHTIEQQISRS